MDDLIARLDAATGQDRDLDARICYAIKPALARMGSLEDWLQTSASKSVPAYTWSIDDALTLLPEGSAWELFWDGSGAVGPVPEPGRMFDGDPFEGPTPARGICIAALKARMNAGSR